MGRLFLISVIAGLTLCFASLSAQNTGPRLQWTPAVLEFDTVSCGRSASATVEVENVGDRALTVSSCEAPSAPFSGTITTPFTLQPAEKRSFTLQYAPTRAPLGDSLHLALTADSPVPTAMGFLFDISDAMTASFDTSTRILAAHQGCSAFLESAMAAGAPEHEGSVYIYSTASKYRLLRGLSTDKEKLQRAFPSAASGEHACTWDAMQRSITDLQSSSLRKFLIVFSGSADAGVANCGPHSAAGVINSAVAAHITVYTICFTDDDAAKLRDISQQTGGRYARVSTAAELQSAMDEILDDLQRDVPQHLVLRGEAVAPELRVVPDYRLFRTTLAGDSATTEFTVYNTGTAPLHLAPFTGVGPDMELQVSSSTILPGDSTSIEARYLPSTAGYSHAVISLPYNACGGGSETIHLYGQSYLPVNTEVGPVLSLTQTHIDFGNVTCSETHQRTLSAENNGDAALTLSVTDVNGNGFSVAESSVQIAPGEQGELSVEYDPQSRIGSDSGRVVLKAPVRTATSTVLLLDLCRKTRDAFEAPLTHVDAMRIGLGELIGDLADTPFIRDSLGIYTVADNQTEFLHTLEADRSLLTDVMLQPGITDSSDVLYAASTAMQGMSEIQQGKALLMMTTQSDPQLTAFGMKYFRDLMDEATTDKCKISCILLGTAAADSMQLLCESSGGIFARARNITELREGIALVSAGRTSDIHPSVSLSARSVTGVLHCAVDTLQFPDTRVGDNVCRNVTLSNTGEGTLTVTDALFGTFVLKTPLPLVIPPGDSAKMEICFSPPQPFRYRGSVRWESNSCLQQTLSVVCEGEGWDSSSVRLAGSYEVRAMDDLLRIPVFMGKEVTADYDLRQLEFTIAYNPTMLYPNTELVFEAGTGGTPGSDVTWQQEFDTGSSRATTRFVLARTEQDDPLVTVGTDNLLGYILLRSYLGNSTSTEIELLSAITQPHNLSLATWGTATVTVTDLPWLEERLVDPSALYGITLGKHAPNPVRNSARLQFTCEQPRQVRLTLHDATGRQLRVLTDATYEAGAHTLLVDTQDLSAGIYYYRMQSGGKSQSRLMLITR